MVVRRVKWHRMSDPSSYDLKRRIIQMDTIDWT